MENPISAEPYRCLSPSGNESIFQETQENKQKQQARKQYAGIWKREGVMSQEARHIGFRHL